MAEAATKRAYTLSDASKQQRRNVVEKKHVMFKLPELCLRLGLCIEQQARLEYAVSQIAAMFTLNDSNGAIQNTTGRTQGHTCDQPYC